MNVESLKKTVVITNPRGFHLRPLTKFAQTAGKFQSTVAVTKDGRSVDGKSAWDMFTMVSEPGTELTVEVSGPDARDALDALVAVMEAPPEPED